VKGQMWRLRDVQGKPPGVIGWWPSRAVTFVENHDTGSTQVLVLIAVFYSYSRIFMEIMSNFHYWSCFFQGHWPFPSEHIMEASFHVLLLFSFALCLYFELQF
jgi:alpha-amylase